MDIKLAHLHRGLEEEIYMEQLEGFIAQGEGEKVCRLMYSLYILKQAGWVWNRTFAHTIKRKLGFNTIHSDAGVYILCCHHKRGILKWIWSSFYMLMTYYSWEKTFPRLMTSGKSQFDLAGLAYLRHLKLSLRQLIVGYVDENRLFLLKRTLSRLSEAKRS